MDYLYPKIKELFLNLFGVLAYWAPMLQTVHTGVSGHDPLTHLHFLMGDFW